ncbi:MAG: hypothetical protein ABMB14_19510 [Myxococcota bacterium]
MAAWFQMGGMSMYVILATGALVGCGAGLAFLIAVVAWFVRPLRIVARLGGILAIFACLLPMIFGVIGSTIARANVNSALEGVDPELKGAVAAQGYAEAKVPTVFGGVTSCLVLMPAALAALVALSVPKPPDPDEEG